jgi:hypothetical protein
LSGAYINNYFKANPSKEHISKDACKAGCEAIKTCEAFDYNSVTKYCKITVPVVNPTPKVTE